RVPRDVVRRAVAHPARLGVDDRAFATGALPDRVRLPGREVDLVLELGLGDRLGGHDICSDFVSRYSSRPYFPSSPRCPECLWPPRGAMGLNFWPLMSTCPAWMRRATWVACS